MQLLGQASTVRMLLGACWNLIFELNLHNETVRVFSTSGSRRAWLTVVLCRTRSGGERTPTTDVLARDRLGQGV